MCVKKIKNLIEKIIISYIKLKNTRKNIYNLSKIFEIIKEELSVLKKNTSEKKIHVFIHEY